MQILVRTSGAVMLGAFFVLAGLLAYAVVAGAIEWASADPVGAAVTVVFAVFVTSPLIVWLRS